MEIASTVQFQLYYTTQKDTIKKSRKVSKNTSILTNRITENNLLLQKSIKSPII